MNEYKKVGAQVLTPLYTHSKAKSSETEWNGAWRTWWTPEEILGTVFIVSINNKGFNCYSNWILSRHIPHCLTPDNIYFPSLTVLQKWKAIVISNVNCVFPWDKGYFNSLFLCIKSLIQKSFPYLETHNRG